jgi:chorismate mutase
MNREQIQQMVDKLKHDLYIRGIDENNCADTYNMVMRITYESVINRLLEDTQ